MSSEQEGQPGGRQIEVDALFAAQQAERRRHRSRVAAVAVAALAAGGLVGGVVIGAIDGDDGGQPVARETGTSAGPSGSGPDESGQPAPDQAETGDEPLPGAEETGRPEADEIPSDSLANGTGAGPGEQSGGSAQTSPPPGQPGGAAETPPAPAPSAEPVRHVVQQGENLWCIAAGALGPDASAQQVLDAWPEIYAANRDLIGDDPDLLLPGQELVLPRLA